MTLPGPRTMFLLDGFGALTTALLLCLALPSIAPLIGLPRSTLIGLGLVGAVFAVYSFACSRFVTTRWAQALRLLIAANLFYCALSAAVVASHLDSITALGLAYFVGEIAIIIALVAVEVAVAHVTG